MGKCHLREISRGIFLMADGEAIRFAAEELRCYYERTAGLPLYITDSTESAGFVLAVEPETEQLTDRFQLEEREGRIWICGVNPRSVIYGVYYFLETYLHIRILRPGLESVPVLGEPVREIQPVTITAAFPRRGFNLAPSDPADLDLAMKLGYNVCTIGIEEWEANREDYLRELRRRDMLLDVGGHCMDSFLNIRDTFREHPDWFGLYEGKRMDLQPCFSNPNTVALFVQNAVNFCRRNPEIDNLTIWPNDNGSFCQCEQCRAAGFMGTYFRLLDALKEALKAEGLPVTLQHIAYNAGLAWEMIDTIPEEFHTDTLVAPWGRNYTYSLADEKAAPRDKRFQRIIRDWAAASRRNGVSLSIYEYYGDYWMFSALFPPLGRVIFQDTAVYRDWGVSMLRSLNFRYDHTIASAYELTHRPLPRSASLYEFNSENSVMWFNIAMLGRALWNPGAGYEKQAADYCAACYGSRAADALALLDTLEKVLAPLCEYSTTLFRRRLIDVWVRDIHSKNVYETLREWSPEIENLSELEESIRAVGETRDRLLPALTKTAEWDGAPDDPAFRRLWELLEYLRYLAVKLDSIHKQYAAQKHILRGERNQALLLLKEALLEEYGICGHQAADCERWIRQLEEQ